MIETAILIKFLNGELIASKRKEVEQFLIDHPHYYDILEGLSNIQKEESNERNLETQLQQKKEKLRSRIFS